MEHFAYGMEPCEQTFGNYDDTYPPSKIKVSLKNKELWTKFHGLETEMIITKSGRRMFPSLHVQLADMDPQAHYCIFLEMTPASRCRFKYSSAAGWAPAGSEEAQSPHRIYLHPESPAKGEYWMSQPVSFGRLKLTNTPSPPLGQVVLSSMHKYQPRIIIAKTNNPRTIAWAPSTCAVFPETQFIAVTAYQNEKITQLKIDNNPFAKGFRENGQAKCKRKRTNVEEKDEEVICVTEEHSKENKNEAVNFSINSSICSTESDQESDRCTEGTLSPRSRRLSESDTASTPLSPMSVQGTPTVNTIKHERKNCSETHSNPKTYQVPSLSASPHSPSSHIAPQNYYPPAYHYQTPNPYYSFWIGSSIPSAYTSIPYPYYTGYFPSSMYFYPPQGAGSYTGAEEKPAKRPKKLTDFSIKTLIGV